METAAGVPRSLRASRGQCAVIGLIDISREGDYNFQRSREDVSFGYTQQDFADTSDSKLD